MNWTKTLTKISKHDNLHTGIMLFCAANMALGICANSLGALVLGMTWAGIGFIAAESLPE